MSKVIMPESLTAENGAKYLFSGEFHEYETFDCYECDTDDPDYEKGCCDICDGAGTIRHKHTVSWTTIKEIYKMAVKHLGVTP